jgi:hypothetical protein
VRPRVPRAGRRLGCLAAALARRPTRSSGPRGAAQALALAEAANVATAVSTAFPPTAALINATWGGMRRAMARQRQQQLGPAQRLRDSAHCVVPPAPVCEEEEEGDGDGGGGGGKGRPAASGGGNGGVGVAANGGGPVAEAKEAGLADVVAAARRQKAAATASMDASDAAGAGPLDSVESEDGGGFRKAWRAAAAAAALVADSAARVTSSTPLGEWWASRPSRAGDRSARRRGPGAGGGGGGGGAGGGLVHGMWRAKASGALDRGGSFRRREDRPPEGLPGKPYYSLGKRCAGPRRQTRGKKKGRPVPFIGDLRRRTRPRWRKGGASAQLKCLQPRNHPAACPLAGKPTPPG